jgi:hypothetical protein
MNTNNVDHGTACGTLAHCVPPVTGVVTTKQRGPHGGDHHGEGDVGGVGGGGGSKSAATETSGEQTNKPADTNGENALVDAAHRAHAASGLLVLKMAPAAAGVVPRLCGEWLDWTPDLRTEVARKTARSTRAAEPKPAALPAALPETPATTDVAQAVTADVTKAVECMKLAAQSAAQTTQAAKDAVKAAADTVKAVAEAQQALVRLPMSLVFAFVTVAIMCVIVVCITAITLACRQGKE